MKQLNSEDVVLSIVIPTVGRKLLLEDTLDSFLLQLEQTKVKLEFIVSDNASDDGTVSLFSEGGKFYNKIKYVRLDKRVNADESFDRAVNIASGKFVLLFGDDDIPLPGFISEITSALAINSNIDIVYVNRIVGDMHLNNTTHIPHPDSPYGMRWIRLSPFIQEFTYWPGFISCFIFSKQSWINGSSFYTGFEGYNQLSRVYNGSIKKEVCYIASPLVIQRVGIHPWKKHWPRYSLVSMPSLLDNLEKKSITTGALEKWQKKEISTRRFFIDCFVAKAYNYPISSNFWKDSRKYQKSRIRLFISYFVQYFIPALLAKFMYSKTKKMT